MLQCLGDAAMFGKQNEAKEAFVLASFVKDTTGNQEKK